MSLYGVSPCGPVLLVCRGHRSGRRSRDFGQGDRCRGKLMARNLILDPDHWRLRAEETRTVGDQMTHKEARTIMRPIAMDYDRLAKLAGVHIVQKSIERKTWIRFCALADPQRPNRHLSLLQSSSPSLFPAG